MICSSGEILFYLWPSGNFVEDIGNRRDRKTLFYDAEGTAIIPNFDSELKTIQIVCKCIYYYYSVIIIQKGRHHQKLKEYKSCTRFHNNGRSDTIL